MHKMPLRGSRRQVQIILQNAIYFVTPASYTGTFSPHFKAIPALISQNHRKKHLLIPI